jgi:tetratricopeptide (TPR) repeat protein
VTGPDHKRIALLPVLGLMLVLALTATGKDQLPSQEDVPYGIASDYLIGRQLLKEGQYAEALGYLHLVYRTHPDVPSVAVDFQDALVAEGYFQDALEVMDRLVAAYPDSFAFLLQRSNLNVKLGNAEAALGDLRAIRQQGGATVEVIIAEANLLAAQDDLNQALDVYRDGIHLFPEQGDRLYLGMVALLQRDGQDSAMLATLEEGLGAYPDSPDLWLVHVRTLAAVGRHEQALAQARLADAHFQDREPEFPADDQDPMGDMLPPGHPLPQPPDSYLVELADFYVQQGEVQRGVDILAPLSEAGELNLTPSLWLARIYLGTGQLEAGSRLVESILVQWPESGRAWFLKGKIVEAGDDWEGAVPLFDRAAELAPHDGEIRLALVRAMLVAWEKDLHHKSPDEAQRARRDRFEKQAVAALTLVPHGNADGQLVLGYAFRSLDDPWRAERCFELASAAPELRITALTQRSVCLDEMGEVDKARAVLERLHEDHPDDPEVANSLGYFLAEKGQDLEKARDLIQIALEAQPGNGAFLDSMGWVLYRLGSTEAAFDYMIQAVNVLPDDPVILEHLGMVMLDLGQTEEAGTMLLRAKAMGGDAARIDEVLENLTRERGTGNQDQPHPERP